MRPYISTSFNFFLPSPMLLAIDKPTGITSYDVIRRLKPLFPRKTKIGHAGTLDPMATGLMLVGVYREGTKLLHYLQGLDKIYTTTIDFSIETDTRDMDYRDTIMRHDVIQRDGQIYVQKKGLQKKGGYDQPLPPTSHSSFLISAPALNTLKSTLNTLIPSAHLPLTPFNAKKINGKKGYELARAGTPRIETKEMKVYGFEILAYDFPQIKLKLDVGSGTYIRSIGHRLGQQFDLGGTLTQLRRESIGGYILSEIRLDQEVEGMRFGKTDLLQCRYSKLTGNTGFFY